MKKVLFAGALAACMALSSAAFAADVEFGTDGITGTYNTDNGTVSVASIPTDLTTGADQLTLVILSGSSNDNPTIVKESIMYIDQDSASNAEKFQSMGLLNGLDEGTYTLRMGSDAAAAIAEVEFTVTSGTTPESTITFVWGDVNEDGSCSQTDAMDILTCSAGGNSIVGNSTHELNKPTLKSDGTYSTHIWGDVNEDGSCSQTDAMDILTCSAGGNSIVGNSTHELNKPVTIK